MSLIRTILKLQNRFRKQTYSVSPNHDTFSTTQFSLHHVHMTDSDPLPKTSSFYNVRPTSHTPKPRVFTSLP